VGKKVTLELKNGMKIDGTLHSVDQFLNLKVEDVHVQEIDQFPQMVYSVDCINIVY
jgi:U6 snRNA-associated Sm-like protein LSm2